MPVKGIWYTEFKLAAHILIYHLAGCSPPNGRVDKIGPGRRYTLKEISATGHCVANRNHYFKDCLKNDLRIRHRDNIRKAFG